MAIGVSEKLLYGWICPKCGKVHSPLISTCDCSMYTFASASTINDTYTLENNPKDGDRVC